MTGRISDIQKVGKEIFVTVVTSNCEFTGNEIVEVRLPSKKKSDSQRMYFHKLSDSMADALKFSKVYMKNFLLGRYGQREYNDDGSPMQVQVREDIDMMEQDLIHCVLTGFREVYNEETGDYETCAVWDVIKHTAEYSSKEMSALIDGTLSEIKDLGLKIDTTTPQERERLEELAKHYTRR